MHLQITATTGFGRYWQYRDLVRNLVAKDLKVRYQGAALGFLWSLGNPLAMILIYLRFHPRLPQRSAELHPLLGDRRPAL